jgi:hypothetical protein
VKKKSVIAPQYVRSHQGKTTHVYLSIEAYEALSKKLKEYEKIKKEEGVRWVQISQEKHGKKMANKKKK